MLIRLPACKASYRFLYVICFVWLVKNIVCSAQGHSRRSRRQLWPGEESGDQYQTLKCCRLQRWRTLRSHRLRQPSPADCTMDATGQSYNQAKLTAVSLGELTGLLACRPLARLPADENRRVCGPARLFDPGCATAAIIARPELNKLEHRKLWAQLSCICDKPSGFESHDSYVGR